MRLGRRSSGAGAEIMCRVSIDTARKKLYNIYEIYPTEKIREGAWYGMMTGRTAKRTILLLLAFLSALISVSCGSGGDRKGGKEPLRIGVVVSAPLSDAFTASASPYDAGSDEEYALGKLTASTLMKRNGGGWEEQFGSISVGNKDGKTVASVRINDQTFYSGTGTSLTADRYIALLQSLALISNEGYFREYWKNPIEGLVEYRYGKTGLKRSDVPDFALQARERLDAVKDASAYEQILIETSIAGLYKGNLKERALDGRSFRELIDGESDEPYDDTDLMKLSEGEKLALVARLSAKTPMDDAVRARLLTVLERNAEEAYRAAFVSDRNARVPDGVSGFRKTGVRSFTVTFEGIVDGDEAIGMINLPLTTQNGLMRIGDYRFEGRAQTAHGASVELSEISGDARIVFFALPADAAVPTVASGSADAVIFLDGTGPEALEAFDRKDLTAASIGAYTALFGGNVERSLIEKLGVFY